MIQLLLFLTIAVILALIIKKSFRPYSLPKEVEDFSILKEARVSKEDLAIVLANLQRWKKNGKINQDEYDHLVDLCLHEIKQFPPEN